MDRDLHRIVRDRARNRCEYCGLQQAHAPLVLYTVDHVLPKQHGGTDEEANLAFACYRCNLHKGPNLAGIDPESGEDGRFIQSSSAIMAGPFYPYRRLHRRSNPYRADNGPGARYERSRT